MPLSQKIQSNQNKEEKFRQVDVLIFLLQVKPEINLTNSHGLKNKETIVIAGSTRYTANTAES